jgi:hypothetical protein
MKARESGMPDVKIREKFFYIEIILDEMVYNQQNNRPVCVI